jgi:hypothetical protein
MGIAIHLPGNGAGLILRMEEASPGWCRCFISDRGEHLIGGQPADYVVQHLLEALENPFGNPAGQVDGQAVSWVMSLASPHASIYSAVIEKKQWLLIENADGKISQTLGLTPELVSLWKSKLRSYALG